MGPTFGKAGDLPLAQGTLTVLAKLGAGRDVLALYWHWQHHGSDSPLGGGQQAEPRGCIPPSLALGPWETCSKK